MYLIYNIGILKFAYLKLFAQLNYSRHVLSRYHKCATVFALIPVIKYLGTINVQRYLRWFQWYRSSMASSSKTNLSRMGKRKQAISHTLLPTSISFCPKSCISMYMCEKHFCVYMISWFPWLIHPLDDMLWQIKRGAEIEIRNYWAPFY